MFSLQVARGNDCGTDGSQFYILKAAYCLLYGTNAADFFPLYFSITSACLKYDSILKTDF